MEADSVKFYRPTHVNGFMSNFYPAPFSEGKQTYATAEHYFQCKKFEGKPEEAMVANAKTPSEAFKLGRNRKFGCRDDWPQVKEAIMYTALQLKFNTHNNLKQKLLDTGNSKLIEHTPKDSYWADGGNGSGKNRLGVLLMKLRDELRAIKEEGKKVKGT